MKYELLAQANNIAWKQIVDNVVLQWLTQEIHHTEFGTVLLKKQRTVVTRGKDVLGKTRGTYFMPLIGQRSLEMDTCQLTADGRD